MRRFGASLWVCYIANIRESIAICNRLRLLALVPLLLSPVPAPLLAQSPISHSTRQVESHWFPRQIKKEALRADISAPIATPLPPPIPTPSASPGASPQVWDGPQSGGPSDAKAFIYEHESGNNPGAINSGSGACGLGQALPCSKMPCALTDYACQDNFFTAYMLERYGTWENARVFWEKMHWW